MIGQTVPKSSTGSAVDTSIYENFQSDGDATQRYRLHMHRNQVMLNDREVDKKYSFICKVDI